MPVLFLTGNAELSKDEYIKKKVKDLKADYVKIHPKDTDKIEKIKRSLQTLGIFQNTIVLDVIDFDSWKSHEKKFLLDMLKKEVPNTVYVFIRSNKGLKGYQSISFELPKPWEKENWIDYVKKAFRKKGLIIENDAAELFFSMVGSDEGRIEREVEKLMNYCENAVVTVDDVKKVVYFYEHPLIDDLSFYISEGKIEQAHETLDKLLKVYDPIVIVSVLANHFLDLFKIVMSVPKKEIYIWPEISNISKSLKIPVPKVARFLGFKFKGWDFEVLNHAKFYSPEILSKILKDLYKLDRSIKGDDDPRLAIHEFMEKVRDYLNEIDFQGAKK